ncbi:MAG: cupin domain-containing protein [Mycobacteriaceae bacterium]|nr:cupin domain-containing protein [Mycobacteriaceae bacterium]MBV9639073.1 cupin domain-containing protein [Mycobacteriaceae bacterium]
MFSLPRCKIAPGGGSPPHTHTHNHAFYVAGGTGIVQIEQHSFGMRPGTSSRFPRASCTASATPAPKI